MINISVSHLHRVMECAGSLFFKDLPPYEPSESAKEGTAAGEYLECLLTGKTPPTHASNGVPFDEDMMFHASQIAEEITSKAQGEILCETRVDWQARPDVFLRGKYDASFVSDGKLYIDDYKYGWGLVEVKENWQLIAYAMGEIIRRGQNFDVVLRIHQPRPYHEDGPTREWHLNYDELVNYVHRIVARCNEIKLGDDSLKTGTHCKYCRAAAFCPAFNKAFHNGIEVAHDFVQDVMDNNALSRQLDIVERIKELVKTREDSLKELAIARLKQNELIPNYITKESYGNRKWNANATPDFFKMFTGVSVTEEKLLSPAQVEKRGVPKEVVSKLCFKPFKGQVLKRENTSELGDKIFGKA